MGDPRWNEGELEEFDMGDLNGSDLLRHLPNLTRRLSPTNIWDIRELTYESRI